MTRTDAERLAYQRGYNAGMVRNWPPGLIPEPPPSVLRSLYNAMRDVLDAIDAYEAPILEEDRDPELGAAWEKGQAILAELQAWIVAEAKE